MALYKFIRLAGDLLPPSLYIAYANMLCGLANGKRAAHQVGNHETVRDLETDVLWRVFDPSQHVRMETISCLTFLKRDSLLHVLSTGLHVAEAEQRHSG